MNRTKLSLSGKKSDTRFFDTTQYCFKRKLIVCNPHNSYNF